jgi:putative membrane protein
MGRLSTIGVIAMAVVVIAAGCNNPDRDRENSQKVARKANNENFETKSSEKEAQFVVETISENYGNVKLSRLAIARTESDEVRELAGKVETDHNRLIRELKSFANMRGISIPLEENAKARKRILALEDVKDPDFDERWCSELTTRHEKMIEQLEYTWENTDDEELKEWINSALPDLRNDLVKLNTCHEKLSM